MLRAGSIVVFAALALALFSGATPQSPQRTLASTHPAKPGTAKLESRLLQLSNAQEVFGPAGAAAVAQQGGIELEQGRVRVVVEAREGKGHDAAQVAALLGGRVEATYGDRVQVSLSPGQVDVLAEQRGVTRVRLPMEMQPMGTLESEALAKLNATAWHDAGLTGNGIRVAVFDIGFAGYEALLGTELPPVVTTHSCRADQDLTGDGDEHGTAVAEIVHDVAPDAELLLVNSETDVEFGVCVGWLIQQGVDIVNFSVGSVVSGPGDGTGPFDDPLEDAADHGILWVNAAGNYAQQHWSGNWIDDDEDDYMDFGSVGDVVVNSNRIDALAGDVITVAIKWDDPWGRSCNDYVLWLFEDPALLLDADDSDNWQDYCDADDPTYRAYAIEELSYVVPPDGAGDYYVAIQRFFVEDESSRFDLYSLNGFHACPDSLQYCVPGGSIAQPADSREALAVGAVPWNNPTTIEDYSSLGPTEDDRKKPDIVGPDLVSTESMGAFKPGFAGTSAAAPHVAGVAALLKQLHPDWSRLQLRSYLLSEAVELGAPGVDNVFGHGRVLLGEPNGAPQTPTNTVQPTDSPEGTGTPTATVTPTLEEPTATETDELPTDTEEPTETPTTTPPVVGTSTSTSTATHTPAATPGTEAGDANCDTRINSLDALALLQLTAGLLDELACGATGDVNDDGDSNSLDAALILQYDAGLIIALPAGAAAGDAPAVRMGSLTQGVDDVGGAYLQSRNMPVPGLGAWTIDVTYDGNIVMPVACAGLAGGVCNASYGVNTVRAVGAVGSGGYVGNQDLAGLNFRCVAEGSTSLHITLRVLVDGTAGNPQPIDAATEDGTVTCGPSAVLLGDVNCDGDVNAIDAALILQFTAGLVHGLSCEQNADVDDDSVITAIDAALILQYVAGLTDEL